MKNVLIGGGSGLVGTRLSELLMQKGYTVSILSRKPSSKSSNSIHWDTVSMKIDHKELEPFDHIIQLAGAGIADKPWTSARMKVLVDSRVKPTQLLADAIAKNAKKPKSFISASAVGYYGFNTSELIHKEEDNAGNDFLGQTCKLWENSTNEIAKLGIATAILRIGIVLTKEGGALKEMAKPIKVGLGAALGTGKQYIPWIHIDDLCLMFIHTIENNNTGVFNAAAPAQVNNKTFTKTLARVLRRPIWLPNIPAFVLGLILGKRKLLVLEGSRISVEKIQKTGFKYKFQTLDSALSDIYS